MEDLELRLGNPNEKSFQKKTTKAFRAKKAVAATAVCKKYGENKDSVI